jgi:hypothetical protein
MKNRFHCDTITELKAAFQSTQTKLFQGNLVAAYDDLLEIFTYRLLSGKLIESDLDADLKVIQSMADLAALFGQFKAADDLLFSAVILYKKANNEPAADYAHLRRIQLTLDNSNLKLAKKLLKEMAPRIGDIIENMQFSSAGFTQWETGCIWRNASSQDKTLLFTELYFVMGRLLSFLGQYGDALMALQRGLFYTKRENVPDLAKQTVLPLKLIITSTYLEKGDFDQVDTCLEELQNQLDKPQHPEYLIRWFELSGKLNLLRGNLGKGLKQFQQVQELCHEFKSHRAVLRSTLNLANILILINQTTSAESYLLNAKIEQQEDPNLVKRAELLLTIARIRSRSLELDTVPTVIEMRKFKHENQYLLDSVIKPDFLRQLANYLAWFEDCTLAFQCLLSNFSITEAGDLLLRIKNVFKFTDSELIKTKIGALEGTYYYYLGLEKNQQRYLMLANQILSEVCSQMEEMNLNSELWQVQRILGWCRTRLYYPATELELLTTSTNNLLEQMTNTLAPEDQVFYLLNKWTADEEYIAAKINQLELMQSNLKSSFFWMRPWHWFKMIQELNTLVEHIDKYKNVLTKRIVKGEEAKLPFLRPTSLWLRLFTHPKDRVTLSFLILPDRVLIVRTGRFLFDFRVVPNTTRLAVRNQVKRWYGRIQGFDGSRDSYANRDLNFDDGAYKAEMTSVAQVGQDVAEKLAEMLQIPQLLENLPKHIRGLTIVPDDILHGFPFAAIFYQGKYLIERYSIAIAYESKAKKSTSTIRPQTALVVGVSNGNHQFRRLLGVQTELAVVKNWLTSHRIHPNSLLNSSKTEVIKCLSQANLLHIACHGTFELNRPDQSGFVFISDNGQQEILSLRELSTIDLSNLHHATLSSCWSADHFILPGRWIVSLPETLWRSGVRSILGCLWQVNDKFAVDFVKYFYHNLDKYPPDEALRQTQLFFLRKTEYSNPFFWAGFNIYGDYTTLKLPQKR